MKERNLSYDLLRFIGILCIMIDHADPPGWLFQLRNFGTPLLIVTSALTYSTIYTRKKINVIPFLKKRLKRLILPAWIFLCFFFLMYYLISVFFKIDYPFSSKIIVNAFTFYAGFRFVWIFKIYLVLALITPLSLYFKKSIKSNVLYFVIIGLLYFFYEILLHLFSQSQSSQKVMDVLNNTIFVIIPYSLLFIYGLKLDQFSNKRVLSIGLIFTLLFCVMAFYKMKDTGTFVHTAKFKFPPTVYYLSYALAAIHFLFPLCKYLSTLMNPKFIIWLSSKSLWIYLWHIAAYYFWIFIIGSSDGNFFLFTMNSVFLLAFGVAATFLQTLLVDKYLSNSNYAFIRQLSILLK